MGRPSIPEHRWKHGTAYTYRRELEKYGEACDKCKAWNAERARKTRKLAQDRKKTLEFIMSNGQSGRVDLTDEEVQDILQELRKALNL